MSATAVRVPLPHLKTFVVAVLHAVGVPRKDGTIVADCLLTANLSGVDSHGVVRLAHYVRRLTNGSIEPRPDIRFERKSAALGYLDGGHGLGHVVGHRAALEAIELAAEAGTGAVSVGNSSHFGMAGYYALRLASQGYIGLCMTPTDPFLVPYGGSEPFFGTNAISLGFPAEGAPVVVDMATTTIPYGKVALAAVEGSAIPDNWGVDAQGHPTTDPDRVVGLYPAGGPKGSGLAMAIDIFGSLLAGMPWGPHIARMYGDLDSPRRLGHFFAAWDVRRFPAARSIQDATCRSMCGRTECIGSGARFPARQLSGAVGRRAPQSPPAQRGYSTGPRALWGTRRTGPIGQRRAGAVVAVSAVPRLSGSRPMRCCSVRRGP